MTRVVFSKGQQRKLLENIKQKSNLGWEEIGEIVGVCGRTLRDWKREKLLANKEKIKQLSRRFRVDLPMEIETREEFWSARKYASLAAKKRYELYGPPGDIESRRRGGIISQQRRRENPEYYRKLGCNTRNKFNFPRKSTKLAEFIGIVLGDGHISKDQVIVYQGIKDKQYIYFVKKMVEDLFDYKPSVFFYNNNIFRLICSGIGLVEFLENIGLKRGNKIKNKASMPEWVKNNIVFRKACTRGLFDTDGGVYFHKHMIKGIKYCHFGFCFTSHSSLILKDFKETLEILGYNIHETKQKRIYIYELKEIKRYFTEIGSNNPKHINRLKKYLNSQKKNN